MITNFLLLLTKIQRTNNLDISKTMTLIPLKNLTKINKNLNIKMKSIKESLLSTPKKQDMENLIGLIKKLKNNFKLINLLK